MTSSAFFTTATHGIPHADTPAGDHPDDRRVTVNQERSGFVTWKGDTDNSLPRIVLGARARYRTRDDATHARVTRDLPEGDYIARYKWDDPASVIYIWFRNAWWSAFEDVFAVHDPRQSVFDAAEEMGYDPDTIHPW